MDTDWITDAKQLTSVSHKCIRENSSYISLVFLYVNIHNSLESRTKETYHIHNNGIITKEQLLSIIQKHKKSTSMTQYTLKDTFLFHIPIEPEQLSTFNHNDSYKQYITTFPIVEDINIPPSIFIFHPYNTLYFLYQEQEKPNVRSLKSALKSDNTERRTTKRVRIKIPRNTRKKH